MRAILDNIQKREGLSNLEKPVFDFALLYPSKNGIRRKSKVCLLDTQIKYLGLWISHSKVYNSEYILTSTLAYINNQNLKKNNRVDYLVLIGESKLVFLFITVQKREGIKKTICSTY